MEGYNAVNDFIHGAVQGLLSYGLPGIVIGGLCMAIWIMRKDRQGIFKLYCDLQEKRANETVTVVTALNSNTNALLKLTEGLTKGSLTS